MVHTGGMWKKIGRWYIPIISSFTEDGEWFGYGMMLGLALLVVKNANPISPILLYALLLNTGGTKDLRSVMNLSLGFIKEVDEDRAKVVLPWMILAPGQSWVQLPDAHRGNMISMFENLGMQVRLASYLCESG